MLLVRPHYLTTRAAADVRAHASSNVAARPRRHAAAALADALITDYSSMMFDYALLDRPMIFHVPDYDEYVRAAAAAPTSICGTTRARPGDPTSDELLAALADLDGKRPAYADERREFVAEFGEYDAGQRRQGRRRPVLRDRRASRELSTRDIFIVCNSVNELGGLHQWAHDIARLFAARGHRVHG